MNSLLLVLGFFSHTAYEVALPAISPSYETGGIADRECTNGEYDQCVLNCEEKVAGKVATLDKVTCRIDPVFYSTPNPGVYERPVCTCYITEYYFPPNPTGPVY